MSAFALSLANLIVSCLKKLSYHLSSYGVSFLFSEVFSGIQDILLFSLIIFGLAKSISYNIFKIIFIFGLDSMFKHAVLNI